MVQEFTEVDAFMTAFREKAASGEKFMVLFTGTIDEVTNASWCPDCVVAKPHIARIIEASAGGRVLLKGVVSRDEWRGNTGHPYRAKPFGTEGVPTMALYEGTTQLYKVDELD